MASLEKNRIKVLAFFAIGLIALAGSLGSGKLAVSANPDRELDEIAAYRTWTRVTKEPVRGAALANLINPQPIAETPADAAPPVDITPDVGG